MKDNMDVIKWRSSFDTGIAEMDEEHRRIIDVINQLYRMLRGHEENGDLEGIYTILKEYSELHFEHEEELLRSNDYPDMKEQGDSHREFVEKLEEIREDLKANDPSVIPGVYKYLREWWIGHIVESDKKYGPFLKEKGL